MAFKVVVQTRPRAPLNGPPVYVRIDWPNPGEYITTLDPFDATDFTDHVTAESWLAFHPELLPGTLFVKWVFTH